MPGQESSGEVGGVKQPRAFKSESTWFGNFRLYGGNDGSMVRGRAVARSERGGWVQLAKSGANESSSQPT